jgi:tRNA (guanine-N7-)-methyltransferase
MGAPGRPTRWGEGPWGQDTRPVDVGRLSKQNPYVALHREQPGLAVPADEAWRWKGRWGERFGRQAPLCLEIGPGNGSFLAELAARHPETDHVAIEIRYKRVVACARKLSARGLRNAVVCRYHAAHTEDLFEPGSLSTIWVNHPDPWPKERHEKNRLISRWFLQDVVRLLAVGGTFRLKSDFRPNVERAAELLDHDGEGASAPHLPLRITGRSEDITTGPAPWEGDIETSYQKKFRLRGEPVYAIELVRVEGDIPMQG